MTDNPGWQPPAGEWAAPQAPQPGFSPGAPGASAASGGWAPPPKPGLIPLRPLSFGTIIGSSFRVMRRNPGPTFGLSIVLYGGVMVLYAVVLVGFVALLSTRTSSALAEDQDAIYAGTLGALSLGQLLPVGLAVVAAGFLQGIISLEVSRATLGEKLRLRGLWRLARGRIGALFGWSFLLLAIFVVAAILSTVFSAVFILAASMSTDPAAIIASTIGALVVGLLVFLGFIVLGVWIGTKLSLVPTVIVLERLSIRKAMARSWSLIKGNFWRTFGIELLISVIVSTASSIVLFPLIIGFGIFASLINPSSDPEATVASVAVVGVIYMAVTVVVGAVGLVMQSASLSLIYIDIRMRKEGLDLELMQFVEAKAAGTPGIENPYLARSGQVTSVPQAAGAIGSPWA